MSVQEQWPRMRRWLILALTSFIIMAVIDAYPAFVHFRAATYASGLITPDQRSYCPGDEMTYDVTLSRAGTGPVRVIESWCRLRDGLCMLTQSTAVEAVISEKRDALKFKATRNIPNSSTMKSGEMWELVHASYLTREPDDFSMYRVPFTISFGCVD